MSPASGDTEFNDRSLCQGTHNAGEKNLCNSTVKILLSSRCVSIRMQILSPSRLSGLKDLALPKLQHRSQLWLRSDPWPRELHMPQSGQKKKEKRKKKRRKEKRKKKCCISSLACELHIPWRGQKRKRKKKIVEKPPLLKHCDLRQVFLLPCTALTSIN